MERTPEPPAGDPGKALIPHASILPGLRRVHEGGARHLADALCLYEARRAQDAIPSLVLSIEECLKGIYMAISHRRERGISASEWGQLQDHKFKLGRVKALAEDTPDVAAFAEVCQQYALCTLDPVVGYRSVSPSTVIKCNNEITRVTPAMRLLRHVCTYHNRNHETSEWDVFASLPEYVQRAVAFHVLHIAKFYHDLLARNMERVILQPCPEACPGLSKVPRNPFKSSTARAVLESIRETKSVSACSRHLTEKIISACRRVEMQNSDHANLHPFVGAISELVSETPNLRDGGHRYSSDDSGQTGTRMPETSVSISVSRKNGLIRLERADINLTPCDVYDSRIAMVLEAEKIIERRPGPDVRPSVVSEVFAKLGITARRFSEGEASLALAGAAKLLAAGRLRGYPGHVVGSIGSAAPGGWSSMGRQARHVAYALHASDPSAIMLAGYTGPVRKHRLRAEAWDALCAQKAIYDAAG